MQAPSTFRIAPTDGTYLWHKSRRDFWRKHRDHAAWKAEQESIFPGIIRDDEKELRKLYHGKRTSFLSQDLPPGTLSCSVPRLNSAGIDFPGIDARGRISGDLDCLIAFDDGTHGVIDFKQARRTSEKDRLYAFQLWAYAYCLDHPWNRVPATKGVTHLGLLYIESLPRHRVEHDSELGKTLLLSRRPRYVPVPVDEKSFLATVRQMLLVLSSDTPPQESGPRIFPKAA